MGLSSTTGFRSCRGCWTSSTTGRADFVDEASKVPTFGTISDAARHARLKCEKYYKIADDNSFSDAAVILNSTMKKQCFVDRWSSGTVEQCSWIPQVEEQVGSIGYASASMQGWRARFNLRTQRESASLLAPMT